MIETFLLAAVTFTCMIPIHILLCHLTGSNLFVRRSQILLLLALAASLVLLPPVHVIDYLFFVFCVTALWNAYLIFFINLQNSISFRIIMKIRKSPAQAMTRNKLDEDYPDNDILQDRLEAMVANKFIYRSGDGYAITKQGKGYARIISSVRKFFSIRNFG